MFNTDVQNSTITNSQTLIVSGIYVQFIYTQSGSPSNVVPRCGTLMYPSVNVDVPWIQLESFSNPSQPILHTYLKLTFLS